VAIAYDHLLNTHTLEGARAALSRLFPNEMPTSILDVGCGPGTWLRAAMERGVGEFMGVDGLDIPPEELLFPPDKFLRVNLSARLDLGCRFAVAFCFEVGEHLEADGAKQLIRSLTQHTDTVFFSAACPGQPGQHHVNCQWPDYWQALFNSSGFECEDSPRWAIWNDSRIEIWYRQNMFVARRSRSAGKELRIRPVIHPEMLPSMNFSAEQDYFASHVHQIENGRMPVSWYFKTLISASIGKFRRHLQS
jgi:SAM-dependent methyltransferase